MWNNQMKRFVLLECTGLTSASPAASFPPSPHLKARISCVRWARGWSTQNQIMIKHEHYERIISAAHFCSGGTMVKTRKNTSSFILLIKVFFYKNSIKIETRPFKITSIQITLAFFVIPISKYVCFLHN